VRVLQKRVHSCRLAKAIGLSGDEAESSVRFSFGFGTRDEEVEEAVSLIEETLVRLSKADLVRSA